MDNKRLIIILMIFTIVFTLMGGTLAYYNWQSADNKKTNVTFTVNRNYSCSADAGGHITSSDVSLVPSKCNDPVYAIKRPIRTSVTTTGDKVVSLDLWLIINDIDTNLANSSNFKWVITKNENTCNGAINYGTFQNIQNNKIDLLDGAEYVTYDDTYYLYIWLDEAETNSNTMNQSFDFSIGGECSDSGLEKALLKNLNTTNYFREADYKTKITDISFVYDNDLPSGIQNNNVKTYDLGASSSKPITGYLIENTDVGAEPDTYKLYISSEYKIYSQNLVSSFQDMIALKNISFNNINTSITTSMQSMFRNCTSLTSLDLSNFDTSHVTNMTTMFTNCSSLLSLDISSFDTSSLAWVSTNETGNYYGMFNGCSSLTSLDITSFDTSLITDMKGLFGNCSSLTSLDVSYFDTSHVTTMANMFAGCSSLTSLDLSTWDTSIVEKMGSMFSGCSSLVSLNVSHFNTSNVNDMGHMFRDCSSLTTLDITNFDTSSVTGMASMFNGCSALTSLDVTHFNTSIVTSMRGMFNSCSSLTSLDLSSFYTANVSDMNSMFSECTSIVTIYVSELWDISSVTSGAYTFTNCINIVGGSGTRFFIGQQGLPMAIIDNPPDNPGYLTYKAYY